VFQRKRIKMMLAGFLGISAILIGGITMRVRAEEKYPNEFKAVAYYPNWYGDFTGSVQWDKLTHVNYAFALPNENGTVDSVQGSADVIESLIEAAHENQVKVSLAIGGWSYSDGRLCAEVFEKATDTDEKCRSLAEDVLALVDEYGFDGVDVDWEYPSASSVDQYTAFVGYLREGWTGRGKLLTAAVQAVGGTYQSDEVLDMLDWINVMAYDGDSGSGHSPYSYLVNSFAYWNEERGVSQEKIVLGVPFYERPNWASYESIVAKDAANADKDSTEINGTVVHYNGRRTMKAKAVYAAENAGGIMIWEISQDSKKEELSLLSAIQDAVMGVFYPIALEWGKADLGEISLVDRVELCWGESYPQDYVVLTSTDGERWTAVQVVTNSHGGRETIVFRQTNARYIRVLACKDRMVADATPCEIRVY